MISNCTAFAIPDRKYVWEAAMRYQKANEILPEELVELIQNYIDGEYVYIPRKQENKRTWGEGTGAREERKRRDRSIYKDYVSGFCVKILAERYYLSEKSIQRIILQEKKRIQAVCHE